MVIRYINNSSMNEILLMVENKNGILFVIINKIPKCIYFFYIFAKWNKKT